ncbi:MAG: hypothetical protein AAGF56_06020, partial [Pseudomonadota bacterium]
MNTLPLETLVQYELYRILALALLPTGIAAIILLLGWFRRSRRDQVRPSDTVARTMAGRIGGGLAPEMRLLASAGAGQTAQETLGVLFLRPTWGLRLITLGLVGAVIYFLTQMNPA